MFTKRTAATLFLLTLVWAAPALAQKRTTVTYVREWMNVCGGTSFTTCASVRLTVSGLNVTISAWNLSGGAIGGSAGAVIRNIALLNVPGGTYTTSGATTAGTYWTGASQPYPFQITQTNGSTGAGSTGQIELSKNTTNMLGQTAENAPFMGGLASSCAATTPGLIPTGTRLWMTRTDGCTTSNITTTDGTDRVNFSFSVNQTFDPNAQDIGLGITSIDLSNATLTSSFQASITPEPTTMLLLGSGLMGLGGASLRRRRRRDAELGDAV